MSLLGNIEFTPRERLMRLQARIAVLAEVAARARACADSGEDMAAFMDWLADVADEATTEAEQIKGEFGQADGP